VRWPAGVTRTSVSTESAAVSDEPLTYEQRDEVAWITINRPDVLNALSRATRAAIPEALARAALDEDVAAVVITGSGDRAFSVGADVSEFNGSLAPSADETRGAGPRWHEAPSRCPKPVIAAINGFCLGGGLELALGCDIRICGARASFALPEVGLGVVPGAGGTQRLPRIVGLGPALAMILTGDRIGSEEAHRIGLVSRVVPDDDLGTEAQALAMSIAGHGRLALECAKASVYRGIDVDLDAGLALEAEFNARVMGSPEQVSRAEAFTSRKTRR
jgi:enoyl-CoA hydratase/carnithine racemase